MNAGLSTKNAPSPNVVLPHYAYGAIAFIVAAVMLFFTAGDIVGTHIGGKVLSLTHVLVLGWITMIIYGALYQLIPVVMEVKLYSEILAYLSFVTLGVGTILMVIHFWFNYIGSSLLMEIGGTMVFVSVFLFAINGIMSARKTAQKTIENQFIVTSIVWLLLTVLLGIFIIVNVAEGWISKSNMELMKIHVHFGIIGWFMMLVIGVASKLLPMFFIAHKLKIKFLHISYYLTNVGLLGAMILSFFYPNKYLLLFLSIIVAVGVMFFVRYNYDAYKARLRRKLDIGMKLTVFSFLLLFATIIFGILAFAKFDFMGVMNTRFATAYGISLIFGFLTSLILGQMYKTLPFIVWLQKYQDKVGRYKIPMPAGMYSEKVANLHYYTFVAAIALLLIGVLVAIKIIVMISAVAFFATAALYGYNTFIILFHKEKLEEIKKRKKK